MLIFDLQTLDFLAVNGAAMRFYGFRSEELKRLTVVDLCAPGEAEAFLNDCARTSVLGQSPRLCRQQRKNGLITEVEMTAHDLVYAERRARLLLIYEMSNVREGLCVGMQ